MQKLGPLTLRRNFSWTFIGNVIYAACQWGMLVVLAKLGSPEILGKFTLGFAITAPVIMFTNLQLRFVQATDAKQEFQFGDYLGLRLLSTGIGLLIITGIALAYSGETALVILIIGVAKGFEAISDVFYGLMQLQERMDKVAQSMIIKGPLSLILLGLGIYFTGSVVGGVIGLAIAWLVVLNLDIRKGSLVLNKTTGFNAQSAETLHPAVALRPHWNLKTLTQLIRISLPLGFVMLLISLNSSIPRYFIEAYQGSRALGFFSAMAYMMTAGDIIVNALAQATTPRLSKYYASGNGLAFRNLLLKLLCLGAIPGVAGVILALIAGKEILTVLYKPEYANYSGVFLLLMVAAGINYSFAFLGYGRTAARYFLIQVPLSLLVTSSSAIACFLLIPKFGLYGAAFALIAAAIVEAISNSAVIIHALHRLRTSLNQSSSDNS